LFFRNWNKEERSERKGEQEKPFLTGNSSRQFGNTSELDELRKNNNWNKFSLLVFFSLIFSVVCIFVCFCFTFCFSVILFSFYFLLSLLFNHVFPSFFHCIFHCSMPFRNALRSHLRCFNCLLVFFSPLFVVFVFIVVFNKILCYVKNKVCLVVDTAQKHFGLFFFL
jgi:hypothetical protein